MIHDADPAVVNPNAVPAPVGSTTTVTEPAAISEPAGRPRAGRARSGRWTLVICAVAALGVSALSGWLRIRVPVPVGLSYVDDVLFLRLARSLADGSWLGTFDNLTLVKGPAYPAFVAAMHGIDLPIKLAEQLTYLLACAALAACCQLVTRRVVLTTAGYCLLALDPINFSSGSAELMRDNWHASLSLLFPSAVFLVLGLALRRTHLLLVALLALIAGAVGAAYWMAREEGVSILPTLAIIVIGLPLIEWWTGRAKQGDRASTATTLLRYFLALVLIVIGFAAPVLAVANINDQHYGAPLTNDAGAGEFARAYADWTRVDGGSGRLRVPIDYDQRAAVYAVSAAARELRPFLEDPTSYWNQQSCTGGAQCAVSGAFMMWLLRDAAQLAGHFHTEADAQAFFGELDEQIAAGCDSGVLRCTTALPTALQPILRAPVADLLDSFAGMVGRVVLSDGIFDTPSAPVTDANNQRATTRDIVIGLPADDAAAADQFRDFTGTGWLYEGLAATYRIAMVVLTLTGLLAITAGWWFIRRSRPQLVLAVALAVAFLVRALLLALIDTVEYDATIDRYQLAGQVLLIGAAVAGTSAAIDELLQRRTARLGPGHRHQIGSGQRPPQQTNDLPGQHHRSSGGRHRASAAGAGGVILPLVTSPPTTDPTTDLMTDRIPPS